MKLQKINTVLRQHFMNARGWRTNRKIIVFESDDWGSIRMPSKEVFNTLLQEGLKVDRCPYMRNDALASAEDLEILFQSLRQIKDHRGNHPIFTFNTVVANPLFEKIKQSDYTTYFFEPFIETLKRNAETHNSFTLWQQGINEKLIYPEFHGREHLNVNNWIKLLREKHPIFVQAFNYNCWGIGPIISNKLSFNIQASFDVKDELELNTQKKILKEGLDLFQNIFQCPAKSFIPNNYIFSPKLNSSLEANGIKYIQGNYYQLDPDIKTGKKEKKYRYTGMKTESNLINLVRNCFFEPFETPNAVDNCLREINNAFLWNRPAIIATHRANYIGRINKKNRNDNILQLKTLLATIIKRWPDVEFMTSKELGDLISDEI